MGKYIHHFNGTQGYIEKREDGCHFIVNHKGRDYLGNAKLEDANVIFGEVYDIEIKDKFENGIVLIIHFIIGGKYVIYLTKSPESKIRDDRNLLFVRVGIVALITMFVFSR